MKKGDAKEINETITPYVNTAYPVKTAKHPAVIEGFVLENTEEKARKFFLLCYHKVVYDAHHNIKGIRFTPSYRDVG